MTRSSEFEGTTPHLSGEHEAVDRDPGLSQPGLTPPLQQQQTPVPAPARASPPNAVAW